MNRSQGLVAAAAVLALLVLGFVALAWGFERKTEWVETGYGAEARRDPYLAASRFLRDMGLEVRVIASGRALGALPPAGSTLLVPVARRSLEARVPELIRWIRSGGHLVVVPNGVGDQDTLLGAYGVSAVPRAGIRGRLRLEGDDGATLSVSLDAGVFLKEGRRKASWRALGADGALILRYGDGDGTLTVVAGSGFMRNELIGSGDDAKLLWRLAGPEGLVTLVAADQAPGLLALLWASAPAALLWAAALLAAFLWRSASRLAPVRPAGDPPRRALAEHVEASGRFLWRTGCADALLAPVRDALARALARRHPARAAPSAEEVRLRVAGLLPQPARSRPRGGAAAERSFVEAVASMERLRHEHE